MGLSPIGILYKSLEKYKTIVAPAIKANKEVNPDQILSISNKFDANYKEIPKKNPTYNLAVHFNIGIGVIQMNTDKETKRVDVKKCGKVLDDMDKKVDLMLPCLEELLTEEDRVIIKK